MSPVSAGKRTRSTVRGRRRADASTARSAVLSESPSSRESEPVRRRLRYRPAPSLPPLTACLQRARQRPCSEPGAGERRPAERRTPRRSRPPRSKTGPIAPPRSIEPRRPPRCARPPGSLRATAPHYLDASPTQSPTLTTGGPMNGVRSWVLRVGRHRSEEDRTCPITS